MSGDCANETPGLTSKHTLLVMGSPSCGSTVNYVTLAHKDKRHQSVQHCLSTVSLQDFQEGSALPDKVF